MEQVAPDLKCKACSNRLKHIGVNLSHSMLFAIWVPPPIRSLPAARVASVLPPGHYFLVHPDAYASFKVLAG